MRYKTETRTSAESVFCQSPRSRATANLVKAITATGRRQERKRQRHANRNMFIKEHRTNIAIVALSIAVIILRTI